MQAKTPVPTPPTKHPQPAPDLSDMDAFHAAAKSNKLADLFTKIMRGPSSSGVK